MAAYPFSNVSVLINGPSGSGKELVARALHRHSPRAQSPFIALNVAAIPNELIESELFGHEKGSFTGAATQRLGRFEQANGGTLFLDEIGDMPASAQTRLLRVLAENEFYRVGGHQSVQVDVRIIAATHQDLEKLVEQGRFAKTFFTGSMLFVYTYLLWRNVAKTYRCWRSTFWTMSLKSWATSPSASMRIPLIT